MWMRLWLCSVGAQVWKRMWVNKVGGDENLVIKEGRKKGGAEVDCDGLDWIDRDRWSSRLFAASVSLLRALCVSVVGD